MVFLFKRCYFKALQPYLEKIEKFENPAEKWKKYKNVLFGSKKAKIMILELIIFGHSPKNTHNRPKKDYYRQKLPIIGQTCL